jgi:hypothetical protein
MKVTIKDTPPTNGIYEKCQEKFGEKVNFNRGTVFTYGDTIYAKYPMSEDLRLHEEVHVEQQMNYPGGPESWWERYLEDDKFRYSQELEAYKVQADYIIQVYKEPKATRLLDHLASSLSGSMYGNLKSYEKALKEILGK